MSDQELAKANSAIVQTQSLNETSLSTQHTVASVLAARAKSEVEARFVMAMKRPRNWLTVRTKLLEAIERPGFAQGDWGAAWWSRPVGESGTIQGFSIRFAEEAKRCMGNMDAKSTVLFDDIERRIILVEVLDLENNTGSFDTIIVEKTVERKSLRKGEKAISERLNSFNQRVYLREATEDEFTPKQNSMISKAKRNGIISLLPGDIQAECRQRILEIRHGDDIKDPKKFLRKVTDGFGELHVDPDALEKYLGHDLATCSPEQLGQLRELYKTIKDGKTTWKRVMDAQGVEGKATTLEQFTDQQKEKEGDKKK